MKYINVPTDQIISMYMTGKFKAPNNEWKHDTFDLLEYELIVMTEGELYLNYNNDDFCVKEGQYLLLPPSDSTREGTKAAYSSFYWMHYTLKDLPTNATDFALPQQGNIPNLEKMVVLMKQLQDAVKNGYPEYALNIKATGVLAELCSQMNIKEHVSAHTPEQRQIYQDICDYVQLNIAKNLTVADIADEFGYNPKYLSHLFSEISGKTLKQYVLSSKIDKANFMLTDTNDTVLYISTSLGFSDCHNFCRTYKNCTGLTPSEFRNAYSKRLLYNY